MTWHEQDRPNRRGAPAGDSPSRRADRSPRSTAPLAGKTSQAGKTSPAWKTPPAGKASVARKTSVAGKALADDAEHDDPPPRRPARRSARRSPARRALGQVLGRLSTRRAALLALVVCGLALSIAVPLHTYVSQRDELRGQLEQQQVLRAQESQLEQRQQQLSDPAQIEAEARTRLHFVLPGQTPYVVQLPTGAPAPAATPGGQRSVSGASWYQALWGTVLGSKR